MPTEGRDVESKFDEAHMDHYLMEAVREDSPKPIIQLLTDMRDEYIEAKKELGEGCPNLMFFFKSKPGNIPRLNTQQGGPFVGISLSYSYGNKMIVNHMYTLVSEVIKTGKKVGDTYKLKGDFEGTFLLDDRGLKEIFIKLAYLG